MCNKCYTDHAKLPPPVLTIINKYAYFCKINAGFREGISFKKDIRQEKNSLVFSFI